MKERAKALHRQACNGNNMWNVRDEAKSFENKPSTIGEVA